MRIFNSSISPENKIFLRSLYFLKIKSNELSVSSYRKRAWIYRGHRIHTYTHARFPFPTFPYVLASTIFKVTPPCVPQMRRKRRNEPAPESSRTGRNITFSFPAPHPVFRALFRRAVSASFGRSLRAQEELPPVRRERERSENDASRSTSAEYLLYVRLLNKHAVAGQLPQKRLRRGWKGEKAAVNDEKCRQRAGNKSTETRWRSRANILNLITLMPLKRLRDKY